MKGLLIKDLYMIRSYCRTVAVIAAVFLGVYALAGSEEISFYLFLPCMLAGILPMTLLSYDERAKWDVTAGAMPVTRDQLVTAKYLLVPLLLTPVALLSCIATLVRCGSLAAGANMLTVAIAIGLFAPAIILPFIFALGVEKGRIAYYAAIAVLFTAGGLLSNSPRALGNLPAFLFSPALLPLAALVALVLSWRISIVLYRKRARA